MKRVKKRYKNLTSHKSRGACSRFACSRVKHLTRSELEKQTPPCLCTTLVKHGRPGTDQLLPDSETARTSGRVTWGRQAFLASPGQKLSTLGFNNCPLAAVPTALLSRMWGGRDDNRNSSGLWRHGQRLEAHCKTRQGDPANAIQRCRSPRDVVGQRSSAPLTAYIRN